MPMPYSMLKGLPQGWLSPASCSLSTLSALQGLLTLNSCRTSTYSQRLTNPSPAPPRSTQPARPWEAAVPQGRQLELASACTFCFYAPTTKLRFRLPRSVPVPPPPLTLPQAQSPQQHHRRWPLLDTVVPVSIDHRDWVRRGVGSVHCQHSLLRARGQMLRDDRDVQLPRDRTEGLRQRLRNVHGLPRLRVRNVLPCLVSRPLGRLPARRRHGCARPVGRRGQLDRERRLRPALRGPVLAVVLCAVPSIDAALHRSAQVHQRRVRRGDGHVLHPVRLSGLERAGGVVRRRRGPWQRQARRVDWFPDRRVGGRAHHQRGVHRPVRGCCCLLLAAAAANRSLPRLCLSGTTRAVTIWS